MVGVAIGAGGLLTAHTAGAESPPAWIPYPDGCAYFTDGQYSYEIACPRSDGGFDFYTPDGGEWVYSFSGGIDANGCAVVWNNAGQSASTCVATIGGGGTGGLTGIPEIDSIVIDTNNQIIDTWLQPTCIEVAGDVCYVS